MVSLNILLLCATEDTTYVTPYVFTKLIKHLTLKHGSNLKFNKFYLNPYEDQLKPGPNRCLKSHTDLDKCENFPLMDIIIFEYCPKSTFTSIGLRKVSALLEKDGVIIFGTGKHAPDEQRYSEFADLLIEFVSKKHYLNHRRNFVFLKQSPIGWLVYDDDGDGDGDGDGDDDDDDDSDWEASQLLYTTIDGISDYLAPEHITMMDHEFVKDKGEFEKILAKIGLYIDQTYDGELKNVFFVLKKM